MQESDETDITKGKRQEGRCGMQYYLAIDIGASSGRHVLGWIEDGKLRLEEVYRFENGLQKRDGHLIWDTQRLFAEILTGMKRCGEIGKIPASVGVDTWALDYVLLDEDNQLLGETYGYRDSRTQGMDELVYQHVPEAELYAITGIQKQLFNTIYQLMAVKQQHPEYLKQAKTFLMLPDYFHFLLTGKKVQEYTNATSTQLVNVRTKEWDRELLERLGYPEKLFEALAMPGTEVGRLTKEIEQEVGYFCQVVLPATHDTGSAVLAVPSLKENTLYISSGTWSLLGVEQKEPICTEESRQANFTNEGGYAYRYRYLKNIMGLWMIQSVRRELPEHYSFSELCDLARESQAFPSRVDVNADVFLAPESMINAIQLECARTMQPVPQTPGELAEVIYQSLAESYAKAIKELERLTGIPYDEIHIVGGGSNAEYLNELTAEKSGLRVLAGPAEATAIGNLAAQMIAAGVFADYREARTCILQSCEVKCYSHTSIT